VATARRDHPSGTELLVRPRTWANAGALFLLLGGLLLVGGHGVAPRMFAVLLLGQGAKALWVGVELQSGGEPEGRAGLARLLLLSGGILVALGVARVMGTWL
jgi:hypothetical protein